MLGPNFNHHPQGSGVMKTVRRKHASLCKVEVLPQFPNKAGFTDRVYSGNFRVEDISVLKSHLKRKKKKKLNSRTLLRVRNLNPHSFKHVPALPQRTH